MPTRLTIWAKLKAYRLENNVYVLILLFISVLISFSIYIMPYFRNEALVPEIALAFGTSLLATIFCVFADIYVKYKSHKNDQFLEGIHEFGIHNLHFNKRKLLEDLLADCDKEIWISGYRLIMTSTITSHIVEAVKRGAVVKILISPPWKEGFKSVYGENDRVLDHYCKIFHAIANACPDVMRICEIRFTHKPLFNDTYRIDTHLITGPYMHNRDVEHNRISANDFFTYDLIRKSRLYDLVENEYLTLWDEAEEKLAWSQFMRVAEEFRTRDLREKEKIELMQSACVSVDTSSMSA